MPFCTTLLNLKMRLTHHKIWTLETANRLPSPWHHSLLLTTRPQQPNTMDPSRTAFPLKVVLPRIVFLPQLVLGTTTLGFRVVELVLIRTEDLNNVFNLWFVNTCVCLLSKPFEKLNSLTCTLLSRINLVPAETKLTEVP